MEGAPETVRFACLGISGLAGLRGSEGSATEPWDQELRLKKLTEDVEDLLINVCDRKQQKYCYLAGASCAACSKKKIEEIHPYVLHLVRVKNLRDIGYPLEKEDLPYWQWVDLIRLEGAIHKARVK